MPQPRPWPILRSSPPPARCPASRLPARCPLLPGWAALGLRGLGLPACLLPTCLLPACLLPVLLLPPLPAAAQPAAPPATETRVGYDAYAAGLDVLSIQAAFAIGPQAYSVHLVLDTAGLFGALVHSHSDSTATGRFAQDRAEPQRFYSWGDTRGRRLITQIDYPGGEPKLVQLVPSVTEDDRDPVPPAQTDGTIDSLSAMAQLIHLAASTGRCDGTARLFDGRRLSELSARTVGQEVLAPSGRSSFSGPALRCDFEGRQLAGFVHDADEAELRRVQHGSAWLAALVPGGPLLPVRISFQTRWFGAATMYVTAPAKG